MQHEHDYYFIDCSFEKISFMAKKSVINTKEKRNTGSVLRFAHPFFTSTAPDQRQIVPGVGKRMTDFVKSKLLRFPDPQRNPTMTLADIIGTQGVTEIEKAKSITFHTVGDTGHENGIMQELVADAMAMDYDPGHPDLSPAFFLHLGDVIYFDNTDKGYQSQFYIPYKKYPGKIIAIPGNHDGELFKYDGTPTGQKKSLAAFWRNFCQPVAGVPPDAGTIFREMVSQPGAYWYLDAPFIDIVGLYSNIGEGPGDISVPTIKGAKQTDWLTKTLTAIRKKRDQGTRKALIIAVHHPPFSEGGHSSSVNMLKDIDACCHKSGIMPDAVLAAHAHNYQRLTRLISFGGKNMQIPFYVVGCGGRGTGPVKHGDGSQSGDHRFDSSLVGFGYLTVTATPQHLTFFLTEVEQSGAKKGFDKKVVVDLKTNKIV
jgi:hypothetical protein